MNITYNSQCKKLTKYSEPTGCYNTAVAFQSDLCVANQNML